MAVVDLTRVRSPDSIARAVSDYGETLTDPSHHVFAKLVAEGQTATRAYQALHPEAKEDNARKQASVLLAHPDMPQLIRDQMIGARDLAHAMAPAALHRLDELSKTATKDTKPQIDATNSLLDRGGLPRAKEISIHVGIAAMEAAHAFDGCADDIIDADVVDDDDYELQPSDLPRMEEGEPPPGVDEIEWERQQWESLVPIEALRSLDSDIFTDPNADDDSRSPSDADDDVVEGGEGGGGTPARS